MSFEDGYPAWTWYGANPDPRPPMRYSEPPEPACVECDADISDDWEPGMRFICAECRAEEEAFVCPVCRGSRTIQPDRHSPPEECPRCVDPDDEGNYR